MKIKDKFTEIKINKYIIDGIVKDIEVKVQEKPKHTFLGSTDRKGYTLLFTATYYEQIYKYETTIEPFYSEEQKKSIIEEYKEKVKYELAKIISAELISPEEQAKLSFITNDNYK